MFKLETKNGVATVRTKDGEEKFKGTLAEAWQYLFYQRFFAVVRGENVSSRLEKRCPVDSLIPPLKTKTIKILILEEETA